MKNYFKYISLCLIISLGFTSCDLDDETELRDTVDIGGYAHLVNNRISIFDRNSDLNINLFTADGVSVESIEIIQGGAVIGNATVSGETATFNSSILGNFTFPNAAGVDQRTGSYPIRLRAHLSNGNVAEQPFTINVVNSLTISGANAEEAALSELPTTDVTFSTFNVAAPINSRAMQIRRGAAGTYMDAGVTDFNCTAANQCVVELGDTNYRDLNLAVNDTLYYRFTVTSGDLSQSAQSYIVIVEEEEEEVDEDDDDDDDNGDTDEDDE